MNTNNNNCTACGESFSSYIHKAKHETTCNVGCSSKSYIHKSPKYTTNGCQADWIDSSALKHKFGLDYCEGMQRQRWFPSWLIEFCPEETKPGDLGYPDPCEKNVYYQLVGGIVYRVEFDCNLKEIDRKPIKKYLIQDCAIESISASKIINRCDFFKNTTLVKPLEAYKSIVNGVKTVSPIYQFLDIVITDDCELKTVYDSRLARQAVLPALNCLIDYDIASDTTKVNLSKVIDNKTIRVKSLTGNCDTLYSYTYAQDNIEGDGTDTSPLIAKVKVQDNIEGDGTSANRLIAKVKVDGITVTGNGTNVSPLKAKTYVDPNQFTGDGQSPATQYSIKPCAISNTIFTGYSAFTVFNDPLKSGYAVVDTSAGQASKAIRSNGLSWNLTNLPTPCNGKKLLAQITIRVKSAINITSFPVHLFGDVVVSGGAWLFPDSVQPLPQMQVTSGPFAEYGDSRGYCADITYLVYLNGGSATFNIKPAVIFPNGKNPATERPTNPLYPAGVPQDVWFESVSAQMVIHHVE